MDGSSDINTMNEESDEEENESEIEVDLRDAICRTQERRDLKRRMAINVTGLSLFPEDWLTPEVPLPPCTSSTELTIYYSSHSCFLSGPHEGNCNILPSLAISTTHSTTTHASMITTKNSKASKKMPAAAGKTLDGLIYLLATKLPRNVKHVIFALVIEAWDNERPWPIKKHNGFGISLARRYFGSVSTRALRDEETEEMSWPQDSVEESHFAAKSLMNGMLMGQSKRRSVLSEWRSVRVGNQVGALDYFKKSEYSVVQGFARALEHFEGRDSTIGEGGKLEVRNIEHPIYHRRRELGILKEFTAFFWGNIVVDLRATNFHGRSFSGKEIYKETQPCPASHHVHHSQIMHIAFNITVDSIPATRKVSENNHQFIRLCRNVNAACGELHSVVLFLSAKHTEMDLMMKNPLSYKAWIRNVRKLKISAGGNVEVKLLLLRPENDFTMSRKHKSKQLLQTQKAWLSDLLMPHTMNEHELEKNGFGLEALFMEREHTVAPMTGTMGLHSREKAANAARRETILTKKSRTSSNTGTIKKQEVEINKGIYSAKRANPTLDDATAHKKQKVDYTQLGGIEGNSIILGGRIIPAGPIEKRTVLSPKKTPALNNTGRLSSEGGLAAVQEEPKKAGATKIGATDHGTVSDIENTAARKKQKTGAAIGLVTSKTVCAETAAVGYFTAVRRSPRKLSELEAANPEL